MNPRQQQQAPPIRTFFCVFLLWAILAVAFCKNCPYDFSSAGTIISQSCYTNRTSRATNGSNENCCWSAQAAYVFSISQYANRTGTVLQDAATAEKCLNTFLSFVSSHNLTDPAVLTNASTCSFNANAYTSGALPCNYATVAGIAADVDLTNSSAACDGPDLFKTGPCSACQGNVTTATFDLVRKKSSNDLFGCGMAVTYGIWAPDPDPARFSRYVGCVIQELASLGGIGESGQGMNATQSPPPTASASQNGHHRRRHVVAVGVGSGLAFAAVVLGAAAMALKLLGVGPFRSADETTGSSGGAGTTKCLMPPAELPTEGLYIFTIAELRLATEGFKEELVLGAGGSGKVYRGSLPSGKTVAVKRVTQAAKVDQFYKEVELLSRLRHPNLAALLGYCRHKAEHILVYEFMPGGDLASVLHGPVPIPWRDRVRIAAECAEGLAYLHGFADGAIIHRDIKPTNILLSETGQAKLADFGVSKIMVASKTHVSTEVKGTTGYLDPEYFSVGHLTEASDVYSLGVVLLQLVSGQKAIVSTPSGGAESIVYSAHMFMASAPAPDGLPDLAGIADPRMVCDERDSASMRRVLAVAYRCVQPFRHERPSTPHLLAELRAAAAELG